MKKTKLLSLLALSAVLAGCAEKLVEPDVKPEEKPGEEQVVEQQTITVSLPDDSEVESKVSIEAGEGKLVLNWEKDDQVTIIGATTETFKLSEGAGDKVAKFTGTNKDTSAQRTPKKRDKDKVYPNDPCPCGSGKKYKKCCGRNQ